MLLKCKNPTVYSTFNVRTISKASRQQELVACCKLNAIDVLSVQEHRFHHPKTNIEYSTISNYQLITASASKNAQGSTIGGVGFLLSPRAADNLLSVEKISSRIVIAEFNSNPKTTVIACYSPTNTSDEADADKYYQDLRSITENVPAHNFLVIAGDQNAQIGSNDAPFTYNKETNRNGEKLMDFVEEFQPSITNTNFMKPAKKLWTFQHPSGTRSQIDYILTRKKWRNSVRNSQAYSTFSSVWSDHRIVSGTVCLSLRTSKKPTPNPMKEIDWKRVSSNVEISKQYMIEVNNFDALSQNSDDIETMYNNLIVCTEDGAPSTLPKKKKAKQVPLSAHTLVKIARKAVYAAQKMNEDKPSKTALKNIGRAQIQLDEAYANAETEFIQGKINNISQQYSAHQHATA